MRFFVTGASGWIGSAVVPGLIGSGHQVVGLARSDASAAALVAAGAEVTLGTLDDLDVLHKAAAESDGVIHLAFNHDIAFTGDFQGAADSDRRAVETFGDALAGTGRPLVIASGLLGAAPGKTATERDGHNAEIPAMGLGPETRHGTADLTLSLASRNVRSSVVRLPPTCHGEGDNGFMAALVGMARASGVSGYVGDGANRWPAAHRLDAAQLFCLAVEDDVPAGSTLHAVAEEGVRIREVAEVIGRQLELPVVPIAPEEADHFGFLARFIGLDSPASSVLTRELTGWKPTHPGLIDDLDQGHYFRS
jgi:nucleoside-diphosphate-sugar epimerase